MNDIKPFSGDNIGSIKQFSFIPVTDVESIDFPIKGKIVKPILLKSKARWYEGYSTLETALFTEPSEQTANGTIFKPKFVGVVPRDSAELTALFEEMKNARFILDYTDRNGIRKLVGSIDEPLFFTSELVVPSAVAQRNQHNITFYGITTEKAYVYDI